MKFRLIKSRWDSESPEFSSFQDELKKQLQDGGDIYDDLNRLSFHLITLEEYFEPYSIYLYKFLNPRIKKILNNTFHEVHSEVFYKYLDPILSLDKNIELQGMKSIELQETSNWREPQSVDDLMTLADKEYNDVKKYINRLRTDIEKISDRGYKIYKIKTLEGIDNLERSITDSIAKCFKYLKQEYGE